MFTTFDKALAAFFGSIISILTMLGIAIPEFFNGPIWTMIASVVLPALFTAIATWLASNKTT